VHGRLLTLGTIRCWREDRELTELPAQPLRCALLVYLALERDVPRDTLAGLLWSERDPDRARHALNQKLYELRQTVGDDWLRSQGDRVQIAPGLDVDARAFEAACERGQLPRALALYQGDFLPGLRVREAPEFDHWVDRQRARLARLHRKARAAWIDHCAAGDDLVSAIAEARRWVALEPAEDEAQHRLIELLARSGERAEAIRQYESYERALAPDDLRPLDHTRALIERMRAFGALRDQPPPVPTGVIVPARARPSSGARRFAVPWVRGYAVLAAALPIVIGAGWWAAHRTSRAEPVPARSIAVLPFVNLSADPTASQHLSDGLAEELIDALARTDSLRVAARTSSFRFRGRNIDVRTIGDSLDVALVVEGSVRQEAGRLRVTAQLIDAADGYHVWSQTFDRDLTEVLTVQRELATAIVAALRLRLPRSSAAVLAVDGTSDTRAYELFLRGRFFLERGARAPVRSAIVYLDSAVALDPGYALAWAEIAKAYVIAAATRELPHGETLAKAKAAAQRAIALAPGSAAAHAALGRVELELWNWSAAERQALVAIELDPMNSSAHETFTRVLMVRARTDEAVREAALAARLEPLSAVATDLHAEALRAAGRFEESAAAHRRAIELEPGLGHQNLAKSYVELGRHDQALAEFRSASASGAPRLPAIELLWSAYIAARAGRAEEARRLLGQFGQRQPSGPAGYMLAATHVALGDREAAFPILEAGVRARNQAAWRQLPWDPTWDPIRSDPRFAALLRAMGL
jgi:adenylate cyclase